MLKTSKVSWLGPGPPVQVREIPEKHRILYVTKSDKSASESMQIKRMCSLSQSISLNSKTYLVYLLTWIIL